jgi:hypothetical protein
VSFNLSDSYHVHAYFMVGFWCDRCSVDLKLKSHAEPGSDQWCEEAAQEARAAGWYVPPASSHGSMDIATCLCASCAKESPVSHPREPGEETAHLAQRKRAPVRVRIYVELLDEAVDVWRPVDAEHICEDRFRIVSINPDPEDEHWQFKTGEVVRCRPRKFAEGAGLVAMERVESAG